MAQKPQISVNISIARWPDGWSVKGYFPSNEVEVGFARTLHPKGLRSAVETVLADILYALAHPDKMPKPKPKRESIAPSDDYEPDDEIPY